MFIFTIKNQVFPKQTVPGVAYKELHGVVTTSAMGFMLVIPA